MTSSSAISLNLQPSIWHFVLLLMLIASAGSGQQPSSYLHPATDPDHDLTGKEFLHDIGANFVALIDTRSIAPLMAGAAGTGFAAIPEQSLERHFARGDMWGGWGDPGKYVGNPVILAGISGSLFAMSRKSDDRKFRSLAYSLLHGSIMSSAITQSAKAGTQRLRPNGEDHFAFPSGHATDTFMFATVLAEHYGWKAAVPGYVVAAYVCATRLEERKHHLTDVAAGAAIGYLVGKTVSRRMRGGKQSIFGWQISPTRGGFLVAVQVPLSRQQ